MGVGGGGGCVYVCNNMYTYVCICGTVCPNL